MKRVVLTAVIFIIALISAFAQNSIRLSVAGVPLLQFDMVFNNIYNGDFELIVIHDQIRDTHRNKL